MNESKQYIITGMSCVACQQRVSQAVSGVEGVYSCTVNLLTGEMSVTGSFSTENVIKAVQKAGYEASPKEEQQKKSLEEINREEKQSIRKRLYRFVASVLLLLPLMYLVMGQMLKLPYPAVLADSQILNGVFQLILCTPVLVLNRRFFINGIHGILHKAPNMDTLVSLGSGISWLYSVILLIGKACSLPLSGTYYFESAAMIVTMIGIGKLLEEKTKSKTALALKGFIKLSPKAAHVLLNGTITDVAAEDIRVGDVFAVYPGESIPTDGVIVKGSGAVNEAMLTGEAMPIDKKEGDRVTGGTVNTAGYWEAKAQRVGKDTVLSELIRLVSDIASTKAPVQRLADKVTALFVPVILGLSVLTFVVWLLLQADFSVALSHAVAVLVISCPCALGLATPVAVVTGSGVGAKNGILFKDAAAIEHLGKVKTVIFDKTGTVTMGVPVVSEVFAHSGTTNERLLYLAASLESQSEHPIAKAITAHYRQIKGKENTALLPVTDFRALEGNGIQGNISGTVYRAGSVIFINDIIPLPPEVLKTAFSMAATGKTPILFAREKNYLGMLVISDAVKPDAKPCMEYLKKQGCHTVLLTGDTRLSAKAVAQELNIKNIEAQVTPAQKAQAVSRYQKQGLCALVGDGINDAPALLTADVGIAIGSGTELAANCADVLLMKNDIWGTVNAIALSRQTLRIIKQNLFWAFIYNIIGIPLAAGCFAGVGISLPPMFGAACMSLSSLIVVSNALRLNRFVKLTPEQVQKKEKEKTKKAHKKSKTKQTDEIGEATDNNLTKKIEEEAMLNQENNTYILQIEGMMCVHCEGRVKKALSEALAPEEITVSHESGKAVLTLLRELTREEAEAVITEAGYELTGFLKQ